MQSTENDELLTSETDLLDDIDNLDDLFIKPKKKKKILMLSDHPLAPSGVGIQARVLIEGLINTGKYSFRCLGGAIKHGDYNVIKVSDDWLIKPVDGFGTKDMIRELLITERPDALLLFTDPRQFIWLWEMEDEIHQMCPITYWHVWDNDPYPAYNGPWYDSTDLINCLSHKTYEMVKEHYPEKTNYIPHSFPKQMYFPFTEEQTSELLKQNFTGRENWFKALWVNRNATRKMPNDVLVAWDKFLNKLEEKHGHRNALLIMHTDPNDMEGPNLLATAEQMKLHEHVWFSTEKLDFKHMNILYNLCDTCVNISKNEGFGLSTLISMQVGRPIVALCTGGETRQVIDYRDGSENGVAIQPAVRSMVGSQLVPYIYEDFASTEDVANAFLKLYEMTPDEKKAMKEKVISYVDHEFGYEKMIADWDSTLETCINNFKTRANNQQSDWSLVSIDVETKEVK
jgi:hypothetical protein